MISPPATPALDDISERIRTIPGVTHAENLLYAGLYQDRYNWGTR